MIAFKIMNKDEINIAIRGRLQNLRKTMKLYKNFRSKKNKQFDTIELAYSVFFCLSGNSPWFCRIWKKDWVEHIRQGSKAFGESFGKNKFEAYRKAFADLRS